MNVRVHEPLTMLLALPDLTAALHGAGAPVTLSPRQTGLERLSTGSQEMLRVPCLSRKHTLLQEYKERIFVLTSRIEEEKNKQRQLRYTPAPEAWDAQICCVWG